MSRAFEMDEIDRAILRILAADASMAIADIADAVGLTATPCWKRVRRLEQEGVIRGRVALLDQAKLGVPVSVFVSLQAADHSEEWLNRFAAVLAGMPEIVDAWRMSGDIDYLLHVVVPDVAAYDAFYRRLIGAVALRNVTSRFAMERMKQAALPI